jgi:BirA family biotin operon repressor/biotin-[acetyl-CoA-carboxylase] ligase
MGDQIEHTIAGIGINLNQTAFLSDAPNPVSLANLTGKQYDLSDCLNQLISDLDNRYKFLISGDFDLIRLDYVSRLYRYKQWSKFRDTNGIFKGRILNVSDTGRLVVEREDSTLNEYSFKEIDFIQ